MLARDIIKCLSTCVLAVPAVPLDEHGQRPCNDCRAGAEPPGLFRSPVSVLGAGMPRTTNAARFFCCIFVAKAPHSADLLFSFRLCYLFSSSISCDVGWCGQGDSFCALWNMPGSLLPFVCCCMHMGHTLRRGEPNAKRCLVHCWFYITRKH